MRRLDDLDAMEVYLAGGQGDEGGGHVVDLVEGCEAADEAVEVLRGGGGGAAGEGAVHAEEGDDVHLVAEDVDVDFDVLA